MGSAKNRESVGSTPTIPTNLIPFRLTGRTPVSEAVNGSSILSAETNKCPRSLMDRHHPSKMFYAGSSPVVGTIRLQVS